MKDNNSLIELDERDVQNAVAVPLMKDVDEQFVMDINNALKETCSKYNIDNYKPIPLKVVDSQIILNCVNENLSKIKNPIGKEVVDVFNQIYFEISK